MPLRMLTTRVATEQPRITVAPTFSNPAYIASLEANSHRPEVQQIIREGIKSKAIRVRPLPGFPHRVRILLEKGTF